MKLGTMLDQNVVYILVEEKKFYDVTMVVTSSFSKTGVNFLAKSHVSTSNIPKLLVISKKIIL